MKKFDIIMFNMSSYTEWEHGVSNRNYHVLKELLKNPDIGTILAVDYPPLTAKRAARNFIENIITPLREGTVISRSLHDKLTKVSDRLFVYSNISFFKRPASFMTAVKHAAVRAGLGECVVWSFVPPVMPYVRDLGQKLTIFDAVDNWAEHPSYAQFRDRLKENYAMIKSSADVIFTVAEELQSLFDNQPNVVWIPNGVDIQHYQTPAVLINRDIADLPRPIIGYIGVVQERVDIELIIFLAQKNPTKSFVLVGPVWNQKDKDRLRTIPNVHLLGYKSYSEAPAYIQQFDVGIIPHRQSPFVTSTNPMKMYEYLACGIPVVATAGSGAEQFKKFVHVAKNPEDFNRKLFVALEEATDEMRTVRKNAIADHAWSRVVENMLAIVDKKYVY